MQSLIALSTTEAELIALSTALREVISMMNLLKELREHGIPVPFTKPNVRCKVFEDNAACIKVAKEPKLRPRTKHLAVQLFHFRHHVHNGDINIEYVDTKNQIADIFTKPLARDAFIRLRKMFMRW
jgi:ribosome-interacting GTPase 1